MARVLGVEVTIRHEGTTEEYIQFQSVDRTMRERFGVAPGDSRLPTASARLPAFPARRMQDAV